MAQKTFTSAVLTSSDVNTYLSGEGGAWTSYTPTLSQGASTDITKTVTYSKYGRWGRMIVWNFTISATAAGTAGSSVTLTLPATASATAAISGGGVQYYDASATTRYALIPQGGSTTTVIFVGDSTSANAWGVAPSIAVASSDQISGTIIYEAAS